MIINPQHLQELADGILGPGTSNIDFVIQDDYLQIRLSEKFCMVSRTYPLHYLNYAKVDVLGLDVESMAKELKDHILLI